MRTYLPILCFLLLFNAQSIAVEISGIAKTFPETGLIELHGEKILLNGIQIISQNAKCQDSNGQWTCGEAAWEALKNKLDSGLAQCTLISDLQNPEGYPKMANCLMKKENLSIWLVSRGWALTNKEHNEFLLIQENLASQNYAGIWRDGFIPPELWRTNVKNDYKHCNVCSIRRQSFMRNNSKQQSSTN